ncbi:MAG: ABC transporter permease [Cytophagales bacterium]|nr:ABC transporter permease [Cytophagales bacterium]
MTKEPITYRPPQRITNLLGKFCKPQLFEGIAGDLHEQFLEDASQKGKTIAQIRYYLKAFGFFRMLFKQRKKSNSNLEAMLKNYLTITYRNLAKHPFYSFINTIGLAIGMSAGFMILQYVYFELSYDNFFENKENIYRVQTNRYNKGELSTQWAAGMAGGGYHLKNDIPEVLDYVQMTQSSAQISQGDDYFDVEDPYYASANFFQVFSVPLLRGVDSVVLKEPFTVVLSETLSKKMFGNEDPVGQRITMNDSRDFEVTGVFQDLPERSHMKFDLLYSFKSFVQFTSERSRSAWNWDGFLNYVVLREGTKPENMVSKINDVVEARQGEQLREDAAWIELVLQPLEKIHLTSNYRMEIKPTGDETTTYFLLIIGLFVLFIAWINYINLTTARSINRAKEVGIRKVMGSQRKQLIGQFLFESLSINFMAFLLAAIFIVISFPFFNDFIGRSIAYTWPDAPYFWLGSLGVFVLGIILSGFYPAWVLAGFQPVTVLKGKFSGSDKGNLLRKGLVTFQFLSSIVLITGTFVVYKQMNFLQSQELGITIDQTMVLRTPSFSSDSIYDIKNNIFIDDLRSQSIVRNTATSSAIPGRTPGWNAGGIRLIQQSDADANQYRVIGADDQFIDYYGIELVAGRKFSSQFGTEENNVIVNEAAMKRIGFLDPDSLMREKLFFWGDTFNIVGVVRDYRQESPKQAYDALIFRYFESPGGFYSIRINTGNMQSAVQTVQASWERAFNNKPFDFFFLDDFYNEQYNTEVKFGSIFSLFSGLAILVAALGLFGLSSFITAMRTKEIGVRKVLGASIQNLWILLTTNFLKLVGLAILLSLPLSYWLLNSWLEDFANRISLSWWLFAIPAISLIVVAALTVSYHTIKTAFLNPATTLKDE